MTTLVVFDIEAVPVFQAARRLFGQSASMPHAEIRRMLGQRYSRDGEDSTTAFLKVPVYRIVCIATLNAKREDSGAWTVTQIGSRLVGEKTEAEVLLGFVKALPVDGRGIGPVLVTFGGNGFDLPLLRYRAFALGVPVPGLHGGGRRDYWHRFGQDHVDLCDVLSGYGDGSQVEAYVEAGRLSEVADYCLTDVLATYGVFLRYGMVRGDLTPAHLDASMDSLRATVQKHVERRPVLSAFLK